MIVVKENGDHNNIPMGDMKPLQVGIISDADESSNGEYVMRTASDEHFEVFSLSRARQSGCWTTLRQGDGANVRLLDQGEKLELEVFN